MKTVLTGTHQPEKPQPKRVRRSPKKRRSEKSEVATPEFGTPSSAKPSHGKPTDKTAKTDPIKKTGPANGTTKTDPRRECIEDMVWSGPTEYTPKVQNAVYRREKSRARRERRGHVLTAYRTGLILGIALGMIIGLGAWWCWHLFA
jgi:hypothetical protein